MFFIFYKNKIKKKVLILGYPKYYIPTVADPALCTKVKGLIRFELISLWLKVICITIILQPLFHA